MERCPAMKLAFRLARLFPLVLLTALVGCGDSTDQSSESNGHPAVAIGPPDKTVHEFMMAFKNGDDAKASALLSKKTLAEIERTQMSVMPPGSKDLKFQVGEIEYVSEAKDLAHVVCHIADKNPDGEEEKIDVVWALRQEASGWRIAGVAMKVFDDKEPVLYNFENMDDMQEKIGLVEEEMIRRATETLTTGQQQPQGQETGSETANVAELQNPADGTRKE